MSENKGYHAHVYYDAATKPAAAKLRDALTAPFLVGDIELYVTASVGASIYPDDAGTAEALLKHADVAMYAAKDAGRDGYQLYRATGRDPGRELSLAMGERAIRRFLAEALDANLA